MNGNDAARILPMLPGRTAPLAVTPFHVRADQHAEPAVRVGVIGYGHWGPNIVRNLHGLETCRVAAVCDRSPAALRRVNRVYPGVPLSPGGVATPTPPVIYA